VLEPAGCRVPVDPHAEGVEQDRTVEAAVDRPVYGPGHRWRQRDKDDLAAVEADDH
jgi:hypothetical protein